jgi:hypothetical protein
MMAIWGAFVAAQVRKVNPLLILLGMFIGVPAMIIGISIGHSAIQARRPKDMPSNAVWIDAPAVPFGFYRGWWLGCWVDSDQQTNHCRLYGPGLHQPVVYEGRYVPCEGRSPVPMSELKLKAPSDTSNMWIFPGVVVFLQNGGLLVPVENAGDCSSIRKRLKFS